MATLKSTPQPPVFGWCHWHRGPSGTAVLVQIIEQGSGPGSGLFACQPCRETLRLVPVAELDNEAAYRAYLVHTAACSDCTASVRCEGGARLWSTYRAALAAVG